MDEMTEFYCSRFSLSPRVLIGNTFSEIEKLTMFAFRQARNGAEEGGRLTDSEQTVDERRIE